MVIKAIGLALKFLGNEQRQPQTILGRPFLESAVTHHEVVLGMITGCGIHGIAASGVGCFRPAVPIGQLLINEADIARLQEPQVEDIVANHRIVLGEVAERLVH